MSSATCMGSDWVRSPSIGVALSALLLVLVVVVVLFAVDVGLRRRAGLGSFTRSSRTKKSKKFLET